MVLTLIDLLQAHPPVKVSWLLWASAILFFLLGLTLLIYLMTRSKATDSDEAEDAAGHGLLSAVEKTAESPDRTPPSTTPEATASEPTVNDTMPLFSAADFTKREAKKSLAESASSESASAEKLANEPAPSQAEEVEPLSFAVAPNQFGEETPALHDEHLAMANRPTPFEQAASDETGGTQILTSQPAKPATLDEATRPFIAIPPEATTTALGDLQEQEVMPPTAADNLSASSEEDIFSPQEEALLSQRGSLFPDPPAIKQDATMELASFTIETSAARLDAPVAPAKFASTPRPKREFFEPPTIEPLAPRLPATESLASSATPDHQADAAQTTALSSSSSSPAPVITPVESRFVEAQKPMPADTETLPLSSVPTTFKAAPTTAPQVAPHWETQSAGTHSMKHKPAGSVLGLPAEVSDAPLIIGESTRPREDGVAALTNYGKDLDAAETGRGGAIALVLAILFIGGAVLAYFFIPAVHSYTNNLVARIRGQQTAPAPVEKPRAQIFPSRTPEVNKNLVKVRGAVTNISDAALEELQVEITLDRGEGTAAVTRTAPVNPATLAPSQRGIFEIEYEGSKTTGFSRYKVTKLLSKSGEVKFTMPNP
ncbi:MAG: hypothetical protein HY231_13085 [Acidobacteria bacterium]|nr:hypothetical protein [Acidobacteriota bacterium]